MAVIREHLSDKIIMRFAKEAGMKGRKCLFCPIVTILSCIFAHQNGVKAARKVSDWLESFDVNLPRKTNGSSFCAARKRMKLGLFSRIIKYLFKIANDAAGETFCGLKVLTADGTSFSMYGSKANDNYFGRSKNSQGYSKHPKARGFLICCMATGAVMDSIIMRYRWSEMRALYVMIKRIGRNKLLVADGGLFSYAALAILLSQKSYGLFRLPACKTSRVISKRIGRRDHLQVWKRPEPRFTKFFRMLRAQPEHITVRVLTVIVKRNGYRDLKLRLVTTLLNPKQATPNQLLELYMRRWNIELDIREVKRIHLPKQLQGRSPKAVMREFASGIMAYNAVRMVAALASQNSNGQIKARRISHTRTAELISGYAERMREADATRLRPLFNSLLIQVGRAKVPKQIRPPEPRLLATSTRRYNYLKTTRADWRKEQTA